MLNRDTKKTLNNQKFDNFSTTCLRCLFAATCRCAFFSFPARLYISGVRVSQHGVHKRKEVLRTEEALANPQSQWPIAHRVCFHFLLLLRFVPIRVTSLSFGIPCSAKASYELLAGP